MAFSCTRILALAAVAALPLAAQQQPSSSQSQPSTSPQATTPQATNPEPGSSEGSNTKAQPVPSTADSPEISNPALRPVTGELQGKLDTKDAKKGDSVVIRTTEKSATANGIEIPKGSKIVGHVTDVQAQGNGAENSRVIIQFDQAQIQGGQSLPILSVIQAVSPAGSGGGLPQVAEGGAPAATAPGGSTSPAGTTGTGQAGTGQAGTGHAGAGQAGAGQADTGQPASGTGSATPSASSPAAGQPPVGTVVARNGNIAIRTTAIPGVLLVGNANGQPFSNASGALLGARQDVHLDGGTVMVVAIATGPPHPTAQ